jgi:hypothetical protein
MSDEITDLLVNELIDAVKASAAELTEKTFYVFSVENLDNIADSQGFPVAGVIYEGYFPRQDPVNPATAHKATKGAIYGAARFSVVVGDRYHFATPAYGEQDSKPLLTTLLTKVRRRVLGIQENGVSKRPWRFLYEVPADTRVSGAIMYLQLWEQDIIVQSQAR